MFALLLAVTLVGCAHQRGVYSRFPNRHLSIESFGKLDATITYGDVTARVGEQDWGWNLSGSVIASYTLADGSVLTIHYGGSSESAQVFEVDHDKAILYSHADEMMKRPPNKALEPTPTAP